MGFLRASMLVWFGIFWLSYLTPEIVGGTGTSHPPTPYFFESYRGTGRTFYSFGLGYTCFSAKRGHYLNVTCLIEFVEVSCLLSGV